MTDLHIALRRLRRAPALATAIVLTLGLGLGAAAAIFTASDAALVEPLPYAEPDRLVHLWEVRAGTDERSPTSYPTLLDWRARAHSFSGLEGYDPSNFTVRVGDEARMLRGAQVTAGFFRLLGVRVSAGRDFLRNEDATNGTAVAMVTDRFARSVAGGSALDQTIVVNGTPHAIVGVLSPAFHFALLGDADVFVPIIADEQRGADRFNRSIHAVGRLRDHVPPTSARAELSAVTAALAHEHPDALAGRNVAALPIRDALLGNMKPILASLLGAVALLLVIMGANLALLMLTRYVERAPELAMRSALGATRGRVLRQLFVESLLPSVAGAALAMAIGHLTTRRLLAAIPDGVRIDMPYLTRVGLDARVIGVIVGLATLLAVGFGVGPALLITKLPGRAGDARTTLARGDRRFRRGLVAAQVALTVVLLVAAGLLAMSLRNLLRRDVGFRHPAGLVAARAPLTGPRYQAPVAQRQFYEALVSRGATLPGVRHAGLIEEVPGGGSKITTFEPHLHAPGMRMCLEAIWGYTIQTLSCAGYDHNWVRGYAYEDDYAPLLPKGTILHIIGFMDNSPSNRNIPDPRNWQGSGNRSIANMFIDLGMGVSMTDEQFQEEMARRREKLKLTRNDVQIGCPLCLVIPKSPAATSTTRPPGRQN